jgi:hypothetical protein
MPRAFRAGHGSSAELRACTGGRRGRGQDTPVPESLGTPSHAQNVVRTRTSGCGGTTPCADCRRAVGHLLPATAAELRSRVEPHLVGLRGPASFGRDLRGGDQRDRQSDEGTRRFVSECEEDARAGHVWRHGGPASSATGLRATDSFAPGRGTPGRRSCRSASARPAAPSPSGCAASGVRGGRAVRSAWTRRQIHTRPAARATVLAPGKPARTNTRASRGFGSAIAETRDSGAAERGAAALEPDGTSPASDAAGGEPESHPARAADPWVLGTVAVSGITRFEIESRRMRSVTRTLREATRRSWLNEERFRGSEALGPG